MPSTTPQKAPAIAKIFELNVSPMNQSPAMARMKTGSAARCARPQGTLTRRLQPVHSIVLFGPSFCFCQNEKVLRSHHGHLYIDVSLKSARVAALGIVYRPSRAPAAARARRLKHGR